MLTDFSYFIQRRRYIFLWYEISFFFFFFYWNKFSHKKDIFFSDKKKSDLNPSKWCWRKNMMHKYIVKVVFTCIVCSYWWFRAGKWEIHYIYKFIVEHKSGNGSYWEDFLLTSFDFCRFYKNFQNKHNVCDNI